MDSARRYSVLKCMLPPCRRLTFGDMTLRKLRAIFGGWDVTSGPRGAHFR